MRHYPVTLLYVLVPVLGLVGMRDSARQDGKDASLERLVEVASQHGTVRLTATMRELRKDLERQSQEDETRVASLRQQLDSSLAVSDALQQEVEALRTQLFADVAAQRDELELRASQMARLSAELAAVRNEVEPLRQEVHDRSQQFADRLEQERTARQQLTRQYDSAFGKQSDLVSIFQQLADSSRVRALAEQQLAEQAASEAASLARLAAQVSHDPTQLADTDRAADTRVARAMTDDLDLGVTTGTENTQTPVSLPDESGDGDPIAPEPPAPDA